MEHSPVCVGYVMGTVSVGRWKVLETDGSDAVAQCAWAECGPANTRENGKVVCVFYYVKKCECGCLFLNKEGFITWTGIMGVYWKINGTCKCDSLRKMFESLFLSQHPLTRGDMSLWVTPLCILK